MNIYLGICKTVYRLLCETMNGNIGPVHFYCTILSITFVHVYTEILLKQCPYSPCTLNNHARHPWEKEFTAATFLNYGNYHYGI